MKARGLVGTVVMCVALYSTTWAVNSVVVESKVAAKGAFGVTIRILITNDVPLRGILVPLTIYKVTPGSVQPFMTDLAMSFDERLAGSALSDIIVTNQYEERLHYCVVKGRIGYDHPILSTPGESHAVQGTPEGAMFVRMKQFSAPLLPGTDTLGSLVLTVNLTEDLGSFAIDTTVTWDCNELCFVKDTDAPYEIIEPEFTAGVIEIVCDCPYQCDYEEDGFLTALDLGNLIDVAFAGKANIQDALCPTTRMDFDADGFVTALDLGKLIDHLFAGAAGPTDPCGP